MKPIIICDLDGTLIDSRKDLTLAVNLTRKGYNLDELSLQTVCDYIGNGAEKLIERAFRNTSVKTAEALKIYKAFYKENCTSLTTVYPTVKEGLKIILDKGYNLAIVTNKPHEFCDQILEFAGISDYFSIVMGDADPKYLKPDPQVVYKVIEETSSIKKGSWIIGDNYTDLECGRNAGILRCFAKYGFGYSQGEKWDIRVNSFAEFANALLA
ncbi:MAG: HAD-IA family hydrolase [Verrucomicrobiota bacterium]|nr:HAD-IA family hydrolase [Verrucomicrobiota bacterium]